MERLCAHIMMTQSDEPNLWKVYARHMTKIYHYQSRISINHGYGSRTNQWQLGKSHDEGNMPQYRYLVCQKDKNDIDKWILSLYLDPIKHYHTQWKRNQMSLEASSMRESTTTPILQPIAKICPTEGYRR